jgi:hypothetical protein
MSPPPPQPAYVIHLNILLLSPFHSFTFSFLIFSLFESFFPNVDIGGGGYLLNVDLIFVLFTVRVNENLLLVRSQVRYPPKIILLKDSRIWSKANTCMRKNDSIRSVISCFSSFCKRSFNGTGRNLRLFSPWNCLTCWKDILPDNHYKVPDL